MRGVIRVGGRGTRKFDCCFKILLSHKKLILDLTSLLQTIRCLENKTFNGGELVESESIDQKK